MIQADPWMVLLCSASVELSSKEEGTELSNESCDGNITAGQGCKNILYVFKYIDNK